jgi:hypothetical protein
LLAGERRVGPVSLLFYWAGVSPLGFSGLGSTGWARGQDKGIVHVLFYLAFGCLVLGSAGSCCLWCVTLMADADCGGFDLRRRWVGGCLLLLISLYSRYGKSTSMKNSATFLFYLFCLCAPRSLAHVYGLLYMLYWVGMAWHGWLDG